MDLSPAAGDIVSKPSGKAQAIALFGERARTRTLDPLIGDQLLGQAVGQDLAGAAFGQGLEGHHGKGRTLLGAAGLPWRGGRRPCPVKQDPRASAEPEQQDQDQPDRIGPKGQPAGGRVRGLGRRRGRAGCRHPAATRPVRPNAGT
jgi:hypothetical protein